LMPYSLSTLPPSSSKRTTPPSTSCVARLVPLLVGAAVLVPAAPALAANCSRVLSVIDGDTLKVRTSSGRRITVRLIGVDTPETRKPGRGVECGGRQATAAMRKLVLAAR
jgi:micrococcal nuclease